MVEGIPPVSTGRPPRRHRHRPYSGKKRPSIKGAVPSLRQHDEYFGDNLLAQTLKTDPPEGKGRGTEFTVCPHDDGTHGNGEEGDFRLKGYLE